MRENIMNHINRLIRDAKVIERNTAKYMRLCMIDFDADAGKYIIHGLEDVYFDDEGSAVQYCNDQAEGRPVSIIILDIPYSSPHGQTDTAVFEPLRKEQEPGTDEKNQSEDENAYRFFPLFGQMSSRRKYKSLKAC